MKAGFEVNIPNLKESAAQYQEMAKRLSEYVARLESIEQTLSTQSYGEIRNVLVSIEEEQKESLEKLKSMGSALYNIIQCYEDTERRLLNVVLKNGNGQEQTKDALESMQKLLEDLIRMLKGMNKECCTYGGDPINLATGNFVYHREYLRLKGLYPMAFKMFYNSMEQCEGVLGKGWVHNYQIYISKEDKRVVLHWSDGREEIFIKGSSGQYSHLIGKHDLLSETLEGMVYETTFGVSYFFDGKGRNTKVVDRNGNSLELLYDPAGRLEEARSVSGEALFYKYNVDNLLVEVSDSEGRSISFDYERGYLIQVKDEENHTFQYRYDLYGNLEQITNGRHIDSIKNEYDAQRRVTKQTYPDGGQMLIEYDDATKTLHVTEQNGNKIAYIHDDRMRSVETVFTDGKIQYAYNEQNQKTEVIDKKGNKTKYLYDESGNLTAIENPLGEKMEMEYNAMKQVEKIRICGETFQFNQYDDKGNLILRKDALGRACIVAYNNHGKPIEIKQPDGSIIRLSYDKHGNIRSIRNPLGGETHYEYDGLGQVIATTDGNGNRTEYVYNRRGHIIAVKNAEGNVKHFYYNESEKVVCIEEYDGSRIQREYNEINKPIKIIDQEGNITTLEYDQMFNLTRRIDANGGETRFIYDKLNRLERMINPKGGEIRYEYDANGNRTKIIDSDGSAVKLEYDALNRLVTVEDADGSVSHMEYNQFGQRTRMIDAMGNVRKVVYDKAGQKIGAIDAKGNKTTYRYNPLGKVCEVIDPVGRKTTYDYLPGGLLEKVTYADGTYVSYTYDTNRNVKSKKNQEGYTLSYTYDCMNRIIQIESSEGQKKQYSYDVMGNVKSMTDANGNTTWYSYSPSGHLVAVMNTMGNHTEYSYDEMGDLKEIYQCGFQEELEEAWLLNENNQEAPKAHLIQYERDILGNVTTVIDALGNRENYIYNAKGRVIEKIDRDGLSTKYDYTKGGQLAEIQYDDGNSVKFSYNPLKQLTEIKDWLGITSIEVDELGRPEKITDHEGRETIYKRGVLGQRLSMQYPGGKQVEYGYDALLRLVSLQDENGTLQYEYDENGKLTKKLFPNGVEADYTYYAAGNLASLSYRDNEGIIERYVYRYDAVGNKVGTSRTRRGLSDESGNYGYTYDALNRLIGVEKDGVSLRSYGYDAFGNRIFLESEESRITYTYNEANQLIRSTDGENITDYTYDARGNLTQIMENGTLKQMYEYNCMNRMAHAMNDAGTVSVYGYNGLGQRVTKQLFEECSLLDVDGRIKIAETSVPSKSFEYVLDQTKRYHNLLLSIEGNHTREFLWDGSVVAEKGEEGVHYYLPDELGSPLRYMDGWGKVIESYSFDEFGNDGFKNQEKSQPFGYAGYYKDDVSGTYFAQAREYNPQIGRFTARDIVKGIQSAPYTLDEYVYCWNRPLNFVDRDGAFPSLSDVQDWVDDASDTVGKWVGDTVNSAGEVLSDATTTFFNGADYIMENYVPEVVKDTVSSGGKMVIGGVRTVMEWGMEGCTISDAMAYASQTWVGEAFLEAVNFERTSDGVYHTPPTCWQAPFGYNDFYDYVFDAATSMNKKKYEFTADDGTKYTIWMWKGDYLNLGAGCETGIYYGEDYHVNSATDTNLHMTLSLYDKDTGEKIFEYNPADPQWWITGFNPKYQDVNENDLEVHGSIDFSDNPELWEAFCTEEMKIKGGWCFDEENKVAYYTW